MPRIEETSTDPWGTDTEVSHPVPPPTDRPPLVDFGGFAFTAGGIAHNLTEEEREAVFLPHFAPPWQDSRR